MVHASQINSLFSIITVTRRRVGDFLRQRISGQDFCSWAKILKSIPMAEAGKGDGVEDITVTSDTSDTLPGGGRNFGEGIEGGERRGGGEGIGGGERRGA